MQSHTHTVSHSHAWVSCTCSLIHMCSYTRAVSYTCGHAHAVSYIFSFTHMQSHTMQSHTHIHAGSCTCSPKPMWSHTQSHTHASHMYAVAGGLPETWEENKAGNEAKKQLKRWLRWKGQWNLDLFQSHRSRCWLLQRWVRCGLMLEHDGGNVGYL